MGKTRVVRRAWTCWASCGSPTQPTRDHGKYDPTNDCIPERRATELQFANLQHCYNCGAGLVCTVCGTAINEGATPIGLVGFKHSTC